MIDDLVKGLGKGSAFEKYAVKVALVRESTARQHPILTCAEVVARTFQALNDLDRECVAVALLDVKNRLVGVHAVHVGSTSQSLMNPADVFKAAILTNANAIVLVHNHPSGDPNPSPEDIQSTRRLREAGLIIGIAVHDHVVVGVDGYVSLREQGII